MVRSRIQDSTTAAKLSGGIVLYLHAYCYCVYNLNSIVLLNILHWSTDMWPIWQILLLFILLLQITTTFCQDSIIILPINYTLHYRASLHLVFIYRNMASKRYDSQMVRICINALKHYDAGPSHKVYCISTKLPVLRSNICITLLNCYLLNSVQATQINI